MDSKELKGLMEAYAEICAPQEIDEAEKWIQGAIKKPGALHKQLGVPAGEKIPAEKLATAAKKGGKLGQRARLAQTLKGLKEEETEIDEAVKGEPTERRKDLAAERRAGHRPLPAKEGEKYAKYKMAQMDYAKRKRMGEEVELDQMIETLTEMGYSKKDAYTIVSHLTLDEAQHARENPEKFERETRKYETHQQKLERRVNDARKTNPSLDKMMKAYGF